MTEYVEYTVVMVFMSSILILQLKYNNMSEKETTLNYLNSNNIKYFTHGNIIVSFPTSSIENENLHCNETKLIESGNTIILIHNITN